MKRPLYFFICLIASIAVWLVGNLSKQSTDTVSVLVVVHSSIEGRKDVANEPVQIVASVSSTGFKLIQLSGRRKPVDLYVDPIYLTQRDGDFFAFSATGLYSYVPELFGSQVSVQSFVSKNVLVRFSEENFKKVPVSPVSLLKFDPQYTSFGAVTLMPDSVIIYGEPSRIAGIDEVLTSPISMTNVKTSIHGTVKLDPPAGVRVSEQETRFSLDVVRFVEMKSTVRITARNVPDGKELTVFPSTADVSYKVMFPISGQVSFGGELYVDFEDFAGSVSGKCMIKVDGLPSNVISCSINPEFCVCVER